MNSTGNPFRILLVSDRKTVREPLRELLKTEYEIDEAADGSGALVKLAKRSRDYVLMLLNLDEPGSFQLLSQMNKHHWIESLPAILLTEGMDSQHVQQAFSLGVTDFIRLPNDDFVVRQRVRNTVRLYAKQRKLATLAAEQFYENEKNSGLMVSILSSVVGFRNGESGPHILHIKHMTRQLLECVLKKTDKYQINPADIPMICNAAAFHDIGKIAIPDYILNKPGRLTPDEFAIMKTHAEIGARLVSRMTRYKDEPLVRTIYSICRWHHERWDGRGYPDGLVGDQIPIATQVVSLADVYDALTSERCYKEAYPHEQAVQMILGGECGAFNPILLQCLQDLQGELRSIATVERESPYDHLPDLMNDLSQRDEMAMARNMVQQMAVTQRKTEFLLDHIDLPCFFYRFDPSVMEFSYSARNLLDVEEVIVAPEDDENLLNHIRQEDMLELVRRARAAGPENRDFILDSRMRLNGREVPCALHCRDIWYADSEELCGTIGLIRRKDLASCVIQPPIEPSQR